MPQQGGELPKEGADGKWYWSDGTVATWAEREYIKRASEGLLTDQQIQDHINLVTLNGALNPDTGEYNPNAAPTGGQFPNGQPQTTVTGDSNSLIESMGYLPKLVSDQSPGAELSTAQADDEQLRLERLVESLQQQAATGGGAWEDSLRSATENAQATAQSLGTSVQNQTGGDYGAALRNIGNAQAGAAQRAVGQGNILRAKSQQGAQDALSAVTSGMGKTAADQAAAQAASRRQVRNLNSELINKAEDTTLGTVSGIAQTVMSDGGRVPGEPEVFGDDSRNDIVPARLSPGEIVIPRSLAEAPNAPELAAAFVQAVQSREQGNGYADGGFVDEEGAQHIGIEELTTPTESGAIGYDALREKYVPSKGPTIEGGGLLDVSAYNKARDAQNQNATLLEERAAGRGPSVAPQMLQNTVDSNIEAALQAQAAGEAGAGIVGQTTTAQQGAAGDAASMVAQEQAAGQEGAAKALLDQQARDNAFAVAQQQAAWQNTMMNIGVGLDQQARLQQLMSGVGQGLAAASELKFDDTETDDDYEDNWSEDPFADLEADEEYYSQYAAHGGRIKKKGDDDEFVANLSRGGYC